MGRRGVGFEVHAFAGRYSVRHKNTKQKFSENPMNIKKQKLTGLIMAVGLIAMIAAAACAVDSVTTPERQ